jgi:uncharacterized protein YifE (UPF0438 family)
MHNRRERIIEKYNIRIEKSKRLHQAVRCQPTVAEWVDNPESHFFNYEKAPINKIYIEDTKLELLIHDLTKLELTLDELVMHRELHRRHEEEKKVRESTPAVKKAWENYQTLLRLSK